MLTTELTCISRKKGARSTLFKPSFPRKRGISSLSLVAGWLRDLLARPLSRTDAGNCFYGVAISSARWKWMTRVLWAVRCPGTCENARIWSSSMDGIRVLVFSSLFLARCRTRTSDVGLCFYNAARECSEYNSDKVSNADIKTGYGLPFGILSIFLCYLDISVTRSDDLFALSRALWGSRSQGKIWKAWLNGHF